MLAALSLVLYPAAVFRDETTAAPQQQQAPAPVAIRIAKAHVRAAIEPKPVVGGVMQNPSGPLVVAWYTSSARLGERRNTVLYGYTDYPDFGPAVFYELGTLGSGDRLSLVGDDGSVYEYAVAWIKRFNQDSAPLQDLFAGTGSETVTLLADTEPWDESSQSYRQVVAVRADRTRAPATRVAPSETRRTTTVACDASPSTRLRQRHPRGDSARAVSDATPITITDLEPVDQSTLAALTDSMQGLSVCVTRGDQRRVLGFFSENFVAEDDARAAQRHESDLVRVIAFAAQPPMPRGPATPLTVAEGWRLTDGRVVATVERVTGETAGDDFAFIAFSRVGDRWLIDAYDVPLVRG